MKIKYQFTQKLSLSPWVWLGLLLLPVCQVYADAQPKAYWYRYYDSRGIENVSDKVTPEHIRYGYEALDRNRQVIRRSAPYRPEVDNNKATQRLLQSKQRDADLTLKKAYGNSEVAKSKKNAALTHIQQQITLQKKQLHQLQKDHALFTSQAKVYHDKKSKLPDALKNSLLSSQTNVESQQRYIASLENHYRKTQEDYDKIIQRLKTIE